MIYDLPFGKGRHFASHSNGWMDAVVGGWQFTQSLTWCTGFFLTPLWTGPDPTGTANTTSSTAPTVTIRPNAITDPNLPPDQRSVSKWYNLGAFTPPTAGNFGNAGKGIVIGPGNFVVDMGLAKTFSIAERVHIRLEFTGTNILNHTNFNPLLGSSSTIGLINGATYPENPALIYNNPGVSGIVTSTGSGGGGLDPSGPRAFRAGFRLEF